MTENVLRLKNMPARVLEYENRDKDSKTKFNRTLVIDVEKPSDLENFPAELFALKISQSQDPNYTNKPVFKFFAYDLNGGNPGFGGKNLALGSKMNMETPVEDIKSMLIRGFSSDKYKNAKMQFGFKLHGKFGLIHFGDDDQYLYDERHTDTGRLNYYLKPGSIVDVQLKDAIGQNNNHYYQVELFAPEGVEPKDVFVMRGGTNTHYFGEENNQTQGQASNTPSDNSVNSDGTSNSTEIEDVWE